MLLQSSDARQIVWHFDRNLKVDLLRGGVKASRKKRLYPLPYFRILSIASPAFVLAIQRHSIVALEGFTKAEKRFQRRAFHFSCCHREIGSIAAVITFRINNFSNECNYQPVVLFLFLFFFFFFLISDTCVPASVFA